MPPTITLYLAHGSCSMAAHILLTHLSLPFTPIPMTLTPTGWSATDGSLSAAQYKSTVHHMGYVPALSIDGVAITENPAILTYLGNLAPERHLTGSTAMEKAKVLEWLAWLSGTLHGAGFGALWRPGRYADDEGLHSAVKERGMKTILTCYDRIETVLEGVHAVGEKLTIVDFYLYVFFRWGDSIGTDMKGKYPKYAELIRNLEKLGSVKAVVEKEGKALQFPDAA